MNFNLDDDHTQNIRASQHAMRQVQPRLVADRAKRELLCGGGAQGIREVAAEAVVGADKTVWRVPV